MRRFSLDPASSQIRTVPGITVSGFQGYLDLAVGLPDPITGLALVDLTGASEFLSIDLGSVTLCIKPLVPVPAAGILACNGGFDLSVGAIQDHDIGHVGVGGFTEGDCTAAGGVVEQAGDPHPGVCNGPVTVEPSGEPDSGAGAMLIAPDGRFGTQGVPAEVTVEAGPCEEHGAGEATLFGFVTGLSRAQILDANDESGNILQHDERGENFSCANWRQEDGPGRLVLSVGSIHGGGTTDLVTVFVLDD